MSHTSSPLVDPAWLAARLGQTDLLIFDATYYLPNEGRDAVAVFTDQHIPGAHFFDVDDFADPAETSLPHMVPSPAAARELLRELGLNRRSQVVVYDQKGTFSAPRAWFLLKLFGHDQVSVLDGGLPAWRAAQHPTATGSPTAQPHGDFEPRYRPRLLRGFGDLLDNIAGGNELVLDARPPARFNATAPEPRPGVRGGHIPGSRNLPFGELLDPQSAFKPPGELRRILAQSGVDGSRAVITSCGSGISAAVLTLAMVVAGLPMGAIYDGSWSEWGSRSDAPIET